ncbi:MAG TPA: methyltransferase domain-containing protein [Clostridia bacterium]|nr:methyltransferase domain-containing protein [Clostridia bacterium]
MNLEQLYTVDDVARFTNLTTRTIRNYLKEGTLKGKKIGGQWRFTMLNITELLNDSNAKIDMSNANEQYLMDFVNGVNTDISGEIQICTIADYYCHVTELASQLSQSFSEVISAYADGSNLAKYNYYYNEHEQKARYIFFGTPDYIISTMRILQDVWEQLNVNQECFSDKAENYEKGRPEYPPEFIAYLYNDLGISKSDVIADIGSRTGKMSKLFLEKGNRVFCVEPNRDMRNLSNDRLNHYKHYVSVPKPAEDTGIKSNSIDYIVCGNTYDYFDRHLAKPEFKRILKKDGKVIVTYYGPDLEYSSELAELNSKYALKNTSALPQKNRDFSDIFRKDRFVEKIFEHTFFESYDDFIAGCMSFSGAPKPKDENYNLYCDGLKNIFDNFKTNDKLKCTFRLRCLIGSVDDLN